MLIYVILDERTSPDHPLGEAVKTFLRREDPERFVEKVRGDDPELDHSGRCGPDQFWDLDHDDLDRSKYLGVSQRSCNRAAAHLTRTSRVW